MSGLSLRKLMQMSTLFFLLVLISSGNFIETFALGGVRFSQLFLLIILLPIAISLLFINLKSQDLLVLCFIFLGGLYVVFGLYFDEPVYIVLSNSFIFFNAIYFFVGRYALDTKKVIVQRTVFKILLIGVVVGIAIFLTDYYMLFGQLPFKYHASSDILPIVSGFLVTYILATKQRKSIVNFLVITTLLIFIVFLTGVRGVVLAIILTLLALYIKDKLFIIIILSVLLAGALTASYYLLPMIVERSLVDVSYFNIAYRLLAWKEVVYQSVQNNLLIEFGYIFDLNNIHYFFPYAASFNVNPHNSYLMLLFRSGVIGLLIVLWLLKDVFLLKEITISSTIVIFLSFVALTTPVFELHYLGPLFWLFMGMHFSYIHSRRQSG